MGLQVAGVDFLRRTLTVDRTISEVDGKLLPAATKSKASIRTISVPEELLEVLAEHLRQSGRTAPGDLVFTSPDGGPLRAANFRRRVWIPAVAEAGLDGLTFHGLRHTAAGFLIRLGAHPRVIQRRLGHASFRTTMDVYGSVLPEVDTEVATGLGALLRSAPDTSGDSRVQSVSSPAPGVTEA